jgi:hypothetical protein
MAAVCTFSARLDYVTLDLTNMSAPSRCQVGVADCKMSSAKEGLVLSVRPKAFNASCWLQLTGKRGGVGLNTTLLNKVMRFFAVWKLNNPGHRPRTPRESKKIHYQSSNKHPAFTSKSALLLIWTSFNLVNDTSASRNVMHFSLMFGQPPETVRV